ncbi:DUF4013 domain-containing protein [Halorarius litoreus]|uniref:DUF4013 domain-containing protein n=1 Tax=Halorarius litoreus TaxID=2962676 RepID=UPI0020CF0043|nr:DUF4013 domain-containing protein [Halorarius litoreus]
MLREALDFPTSGDRGSAALLVGSGLLLLSALVGGASLLFPPLLALVLVLQLPLRGYYVRVLRVTAAEADPTAPSFGDVGPLLRDGLVAVVVAFVYFLPTLLLFGIAAGGNLAAAVENPLQLTDPTTIAAAETVGSLAALLGLFSSLAALYLVPGAVTMYAHERRVRSALHVRRVISGTFSEDYAVGWVLSVVLQALLFPVVAFLYSLVIGVVLHFLLGVAVRYVWGSSFGAAMGFEPSTVHRAGITPDNGLGALDDDSTQTTASVSAETDPTEAASESADETTVAPEAAAADPTPPSAVESTEDSRPSPPSPESSQEAERESSRDIDTESTSDPAPRDPMADEGAN